MMAQLFCVLKKRRQFRIKRLFVKGLKIKNVGKL